LIQFDAHNDTWGGLFRESALAWNAGATAVEEGLIVGKDVLQVGLRGRCMRKEDSIFGRKHGFKVVTSEEFHRGGVSPVKRHLKKFGRRPVYVRSTIDVVEPAFAPGTGTPRLAGFRACDFWSWCRSLRGLKIVGWIWWSVSTLRYRGDHFAFGGEFVV